MPLTTLELLHPQVITKLVSQVVIGKSAFAKWFGFTYDSADVMRCETRYAAYRIFNSTREPLIGRVPGSGPAATPPNPVGEVRLAMARFWEKIPLEAEKLGNMAVIEGPSAKLDVGGVNYIRQQAEFLGQKANMTDAAQLGGFLRGAFYLNQITFATGGGAVKECTAGTTSIAVDTQLPAAQKSQLNMLGAGNIITLSWDNPAAPIVNHCMNVQDATVQLTGMPLAYAAVTSAGWNNVVNNTQVRTLGGTVQAPFDSFTWVDDKVNGDARRGLAMAKLKAIPWLTWIICDEVVALGGGGDPVSGGTATRTKLIGDTACVFMPEPDSSWRQLYLGGEVVAEDYGKKPSVKVGLSAWQRTDIEPTTVNLHCLYNMVGVAYRHPWSYATVVF